MHEQASPGAVLVAEDDASLRRLIAVHLARDGLPVIEAANGREALVALGTAALGGRLRAILMDVRMPGVTGLTILQALAASGSTVPVVMMTAFGSDELKRGAYQNGAHAVLDKPFAMEQLRQVLGDAIAVTPLGERVREQVRANDAVVVDRYLHVVNDAIIARGRRGRMRGPIAISVVEPGPGGINVFHVHYRGWGFERATRLLSEPMIEVTATRNHLCCAINEPWHYLAHPDELVLWRTVQGDENS